MSQRTRPLRNLAAWGYESDSTGTRVEIDVWTVNPGEEETPDAVERARELIGHRGEILDAYGNVAKVLYSGIESVGYRYIDTDEKALQQAFAGAKRSAGGSRTGAGTFGTGYSSPDHLPDLRDCIDHGQTEILPVIRREMREIGMSIVREPPRDEDDEPVETEPFDGFRNVVRVFPRGGNVYRYRVRGNRMVQA